MAKTKATKTVKVRVAVVYNDKGEYGTGGYRKEKFNCDDDELIAEAYDVAPLRDSCYPYACVVEIELPIPKPLVGKVLSVKAVKP
jgi:hypothetical protein